MSPVLSSSRLVNFTVSPFTASINSDVKVQYIAMAKTTYDMSSQRKSNALQNDQASKPLTNNISRRDMAMQLAIASLVAATTIFPKPAEARVSNPEIKRKIFEKLKMLREKAGLSIPNTPDKQKTTPPADKEKDKPLNPPPTLPFLIPESESVVEVSFS